MSNDPLNAALAQNIVFFLIASAYIWIGARRSAGTAPFPGPRPPPQWFKVWLVIIWLVGLALPVVTLIIDGLIIDGLIVDGLIVDGMGGASRDVQVGLGAYLLMFVAQVASEVFVWKRWRSPIWVIVPCLYLGWRLWQIVWAWGLPGVVDSSLASITCAALFGLWVINVGVHFTNIPLTLRWDHHPIDSRFFSMRGPLDLANRPQQD